MKNIVNITGRLTQDPEIKYYESGKCKTKFDVAHNSFVDGKKHTTFIKCEAWGKQAEFMVEYFKKGNPITLVGELIKQEYEGKTYHFVRAKTIGMTSSNMVVSGTILHKKDLSFDLMTSEGIISIKCKSGSLEQSENERITALLSLDIKDHVQVYNYMGNLF